MIYVLTGDPFLTERSLKNLKVKLLGQELVTPDSMRVMGGDELEARDLLESARSLSLFSKKTVLIVRGAEDIRKEELERLKGHVQELVNGGELVFVAEKLDRKISFWQEVVSVAKWQELKALYPREIPAWIKAECEKRGKQVSPAAASFLAERYGAELGLLSSTLEKAFLLMPNQPEISLELARECCESITWKSLFDLSDAVGSKNLPRALQLFRQMTLSGESEVGLLALLARHFRILKKVKETGQGAPPYFLPQYQRQASSFSHEKLMQAHERFFRIDWDLKSSPLPQKILLEKLLLNLCQ
ncbi:MAG: DNA polymerase III subunit delta [Deltaproteobacteria bacterium]|nr:DNA polymerase III subunit delta [Deltaproteobacteria bacterium]